MGAHGAHDWWYRCQKREQPGRVYSFRAGQRVRRDHEAVKEAPGLFRDVDETDALIYGLPEE
jgi:hypothetical protein